MFQSTESSLHSLLNILKQSFQRLSCLLLLVVTLVAGCSTPLVDDNPATTQKELAYVIDAVQFAIDGAAKESAWDATKIELAHWDAACNAAKSVAASSCLMMEDDAIKLCKPLCPNGNCDPGSMARCKKYLSGNDRAALCADGAGTIKAWCENSLNCTSNKIVAASTCRNATSITFPVLKKANLSLAVEKKNNVSNGVNLLIVSFSAGRTNTAANNMDLTLLPRVRDTIYGSVQPAMPVQKSISQESQELAKQLIELIRQAVAASAKEYDPTAPGINGQKGVVARGPTMLAELTINFSLVVDSNGTLGIKKAWGPVGIELGGGMSSKRSNSLSIVYAREE
ncbi:hypothetical protein ACO0LM_06070 [Undibacterium sp. Di26W]|uniref:hypothetical protein n=1 Tax=Undibacterium sp. Di26W TaxID=3413035 RepID=UPI003BF146E9